MSVPAPPEAGALAGVLAAIDPALHLVASRPLTGGVSSLVTAIEAASPGSPPRSLVVREYGPANLRSDPQIATHALAGILDWEDAAYGDPLADLSVTRIELSMAFGAAAMGEFTTAYLDRMPGLGLAALPHWDLYAALRHAGRMDGWGLQPIERSNLEAGHREFISGLLRRPDYPGAPG